MADPIWITVAVALVIHNDQIASHGGVDGLRDLGLLESALAHPRYQLEYAKVDIWQMSAAYGYGITKNHPFIDGNKRTGFQIMYVFLKVNGYDFQAPEPEVVRVMQALAAGNFSEVQLAAWLEKYSIS